MLHWAMSMYDSALYYSDEGLKLFEKLKILSASASCTVVGKDLSQSGKLQAECILQHLAGTEGHFWFRITSLPGCCSAKMISVVSSAR